MALKEVHAPHLNGTVKLGGRRKPVARGYHLKAKSVISLANLPTIPTTTSYRTSASTALRNVYLNNQYGCCVIAGRGHRIGLMTGAANAGNPFVYSNDQIIAEYERIGQFDPNNPTNTDNGCDMQTAANDGVQNGYADGSKDLGWLVVDPTNQQEVAACMFLFENLDFGMALPDAWINPFPSADGFVWDTAGDPDQSNGHCVEGCDLTTNGIIIDTWALEGVLTFGAIAKYCADSAGGECYVHINQDQLNKAQAKAPNGLDIQQLTTFFNQMGGSVTVQVPAGPAAALITKGPTLAQAQAALAALPGWPT